MPLFLVSMIYFLIAIVPPALLTGFLVLTLIERRRGLRVLGVWRNRLDARVARASFIVAHVDWSAFTKHLLRTSAERIVHDIAHTSLIAVRTLERVLTRTVRYLRERGAHQEASTEAVAQSSVIDRTIATLRHTIRQSRRTRTPDEPTA